MKISVTSWQFNLEGRFPKKGSLVPVENRSTRDYKLKLIGFHFVRNTIQLTSYVMGSHSDRTEYNCSINLLVSSVSENADRLHC